MVFCRCRTLWDFPWFLLGALLSGATLYLSPRFDPVAALAALERDRLTIVLGVPAMFALVGRLCEDERMWDH